MRFVRPRIYLVGIICESGCGRYRKRPAFEEVEKLRRQLERENNYPQKQIAERKCAEVALRQTQMDLAHANRVSSMGELTASLAHEVNQPLTAAITDANTCLHWLSRSRPDLEEARAAASRIVQDGRRASEIVNRVRLLFQKATLQRELVDLNEIVREMMLLLHGKTTQFAVLVRTELTADLPQVMGDRVQLQQVLMNLMMNSMDAMKDVEGTRELAIQSQRIENGQVLISVSDTRVGLPPQQADKIFNAFFTCPYRKLNPGKKGEVKQLRRARHSVCRSVIASRATKTATYHLLGVAESAGVRRQHHYFSTYI